MLKASQVILVAAVLAIIGLAVFAYKVRVLEFPLQPGSTYKSWYVEMAFRFKPEGKGDDRSVEIAFPVPKGTRHLAIVDESMVADDFGVDRSRRDDDGNKLLRLSRRKADSSEYALYRLLVYKVDSPVSGGRRSGGKVPAPDTTYSTENRERLMLSPEHPLFVAIDSLLEDARERSASQKGMLQQLYKLASKQQDDRIELIRSEVSLPQSSAAVANFLFNTAGIPARLVNGLYLNEDTRLANFDRWLEYYVDDRWHSIGWGGGTGSSEQREAEQFLLPWWYGEKDFLADVDGVGEISTTLSVKQNTDSSLTRAIWKSGQVSSFLLRFSLYNLPLSNQLAFAVLLLIPLGGLMVAFLRQVVGFKTFGTFMPVLVALSFRETGLVTGLTLYAIVIASGLLVRRYFDALGLLSVPRLAGVLSVVVMLIAIIEMVAFAAGFPSVLAITLFPIVIMTMVIERMTLMWEEAGSKVAMQTALISFLAAALCYVPMNSDQLQHLLFAFPELLLVVLACTLLLGRYNGYKLTEYMRFRSLHRQLQQD